MEEDFSLSDSMYGDGESHDRLDEARRCGAANRHERNERERANCEEKRIAFLDHHL
jgi:hypothetical protein